MTTDLISYRYRLVTPDLPAPTEYSALLEEISENGWYSNFGPLVRRLEDQLLAAYGGPGESCITCSNATAGLSAALLVAGGAGQVLLPAFTFPASLGAVRAAGLTPVVVDVDAQNWTLGGELLDRALATTGARLVMLVAPFGIRRNWDAEIAICRRRGAAAVIDNASGLGVQRLLGVAEEDVFEVFSMHATKPFAIGEGGAVFASLRHDAALRSTLNFALSSYTEPAGPAWGFNGKMSEFHAAIGIAQLRRFPDILGKRQASAQIYRDRLLCYPEVVCPIDVNASPWQSFPVLLPDAAAAEHFVDRASALGVEIRRYYRPSLSRWPQTRCFGACPVAEDLADRMCVLPVRVGGEARQLVELVFRALDHALARY